ncbi:hypothetical protein ACM614_26955 [Streptomyces sp. 12297]
MNRRQLGRLQALEAARNVNRMEFRTPAGRTFSLDVKDVLSICLDALTWVCEPTDDPPRGPVLAALATAEPHAELGLIAQTAVLAAQQITEGATA